jgi:hypothetical protein
LAARHICNEKRKTKRKMSRYVYHGERKPKTKDQRKAQQEEQQNMRNALELEGKTASRMCNAA